MNTPASHFDTFVEKVVLHNRLVSREQLDALMRRRNGDPESTLLGTLADGGWISQKHAELIRTKYSECTTNLRGPGARDGTGEAQSRSDDVGSSEPSGSEVAVTNPGPSVSVGADREDVSRLAGYLASAREAGASDLFINVGTPPMIRRYGRIVSMSDRVLSATETESLLTDVLDEDQKSRLFQAKVLDACLTVHGHRYRCCIVRQRCGWDGSFRMIPSKIVPFEDLGLPLELIQLMEYREGLVLITGPAGSGKSVTLGAFVELVNASRNEHIITLEDPIEVVFAPKKSHISQREVGSHTEGFGTALRAALREDPDVIVIGELRDRETTSLAVTAAETGHLVFATLHTTGAAQTIHRLLDFFPPQQRNQVRTMVSESIRGIVCQRLVPRKDGGGLALAAEVLFNIPSIANLIREDRLFQVPNMMQINKHYGMRLLDESLGDLLGSGMIGGEEAYYAANRRETFQSFAPHVAVEESGEEKRG